MLLTAPAQCERCWCVRTRLPFLLGQLGPGLRGALTWEDPSLPFPGSLLFPTWGTAWAGRAAARGLVDWERGGQARPWQAGAVGALLPLPRNTPMYVGMPLGPERTLREGPMGLKATAM